MSKQTFLIGSAFILGAMLMSLFFAVKEERVPETRYKHVVDTLTKACIDGCYIKNKFWNNKIVIENGRIDCECIGDF